MLCEGRILGFLRFAALCSLSELCGKEKYMKRTTTYSERKSSYGQSPTFFHRVTCLVGESRQYGLGLHGLPVSPVGGRSRSRQPSASHRIVHPTRCDAPGCLTVLQDRYFRRLDGWVLCPQCFSCQSCEW